MNQKVIHGEGRILFAFLIWSTCGPLIREANSSGIGIPEFVVFANLCGITALVIVFGKSLISGFRELPPKGTLLFSLFFAVNMWTFFEGFHYTSMANVLIVHHSAPVFVAILSPFLLAENPSGKLWTALFISMAGLAAVTWTGARIGTSRDIVGLTYAFVSAGAYTGVIIVGRNLAKKNVNVYALVVAQSITLALIALPLIDISLYSVKSLGISAGAGLLHLSIGAVLYYSGLRYASAARAGLIGYSEIVFGIIWAWLFYGESLSSEKIAGAGLIIAGGILGIRRGR